MCAQSCLTLCNPWAVACQAPLSMKFSRQESWSGLPFPPPGDFPDPGIEPTLPALGGRFFTAEPRLKPISLTELQLKEDTVSSDALFKWL